jgi:hypothetical protein
MSSLRTQSLFLVLLGSSFWFLGCSSGPVKEEGDPKTLREKVELQEFYDSYFMFDKKNGHPPAKMADLKRKESVDPGGILAAKKGTFEVVWGVEPDEESKAVLAYGKNALKEGGPVLLASGQVTTMSAEQLQTALNAKR